MLDFPKGTGRARPIHATPSRGRAALLLILLQLSCYRLPYVPSAGMRASCWRLSSGTARSLGIGPRRRMKCRALHDLRSFFMCLRQLRSHCLHCLFRHQPRPCPRCRPSRHRQWDRVSCSSAMIKVRKCNRCSGTRSSSRSGRINSGKTSSSVAASCSWSSSSSCRAPASWSSGSCFTTRTSAALFRSLVHAVEPVSVQRRTPGSLDVQQAHCIS